MTWHLRNQSGDTIVEVLIAITIVAVVLVGAFAVSSNSNKTVLDNNEHTQAQQLLQSQVEAFRSYMSTHTSLAVTASKYCLDSAGTPIQYANATCPNYSVGGASGVIPSFTPSDSSGDYTFTIQWDSAKGGQAQEQFVYRIPS